MEAMPRRCLLNCASNEQQSQAHALPEAAKPAGALRLASGSRPHCDVEGAIIQLKIIPQDFKSLFEFLRLFSLKAGEQLEHTLENVS